MVLFSSIPEQQWHTAGSGTDSEAVQMLAGDLGSTPFLITVRCDHWVDVGV